MSIQQIKSGVIADDAVTAEKVSGGAPYWNASGNVGIGTSLPTSKLHIYDNTDKTMDSAGSGQFRIVGGASNYSVAIALDATASYIYNNATSRDMVFGTNETERGRFDSSGNFRFNSGYGSVATAYGCRAWVNFDGTTNTGGNCDIRASGNVSTVADNGTGNYTVNFTTAMPDANYAGTIANNQNNGVATAGISYMWIVSKTTSAFRFGNLRAGTSADASMLDVAIFR